MKRWIKWLGIGVLALGLLLVLAVFAGLQLADSKMRRKVEVTPAPVALRTDAAGLERGRYLYASRGCVDCHGANGAGRVLVDNGDVRIKGPNITGGPGGVVAAYRPEDWVRTIRHGVAPSGRPLMVMPSEDFNRFTNEDVGALIAYVQGLPAVPGGPAEIRLPLPARVMYGFGVAKDAAAKIDHTQAPQSAVAEGVSVQHGAYVANMCIGCHGPQLTGGRILGGPPDWPPAANLTPGEKTVMTTYRDAQTLQNLFKTGKRPDGTPVQVMPFASLRELSETDVRALHLYLQSLKPLPPG